MSVSGETFASWATHVTRCSNPTFNRVINRLWSNPSLQKDVLAVLSGITKLLQSRGGNESGAEYYAALLSLLNTETSTKTAEAYLLQLVVSKAVPVSLLRKKCSEASKTITNVLSAALQEDEVDYTLCRSLLLALGRLLSAQPAENWASESVRHTYRIFLKFITHENSSLRKAVHKTISQLLITNSPDDSYHPVCHQTINHVCRVIRQEFEQLSGVIRITDQACCPMLYCISLLKCIICLVPEKDIKAACECVLELTTFNNALVVKSVFGCLQVLFEGRVRGSALSLDTAGKLMTALHSCKPRDSTSVDIKALTKDSEALLAWMDCLCAGVTYLTSLAEECPDQEGIESAPNVAVEHMDHLIHTALNIVVNSPVPALREAFKRLLVGSVFERLGSQIRLCNLLSRRPKLLPELCLSLQNALTLARRETWPVLLFIASNLLHTWGSMAISGSSVDAQLPLEVVGLVQRVASLRDALVDGAEGVTDAGGVALSTLTDEMDRLVLSAMEAWGIEPVIRDALPLEPMVAELEAGKVELRRSWILPLMSRVTPVHPPSLAFFSSTILPLADRAIVVAKAAHTGRMTRQMGGQSGGKFVPFSTILNAAAEMARQLWTTLSSFTRRSPSRWADLADSGLGGRLIAGLLTAKAVRPVILNALRRLVSYAESDEAKEVMRTVAKQMVPKMLYMYEQQAENGDQQLKQQLQTTLVVLLPLLKPKMLSVPCDLAYRKLTSTKKPIYMEILMLLVPHLTSEEIKSVLAKLEVYFMPNDKDSRGLRKPVYRLLEAVLASSNPEAKVFAEANLTDLTTFMARVSPPPIVQSEDEQADEALSSTLANLALSTKERKVLSLTTPWKARLRVLRHLLRLHVEQFQREQQMDGEENQPKESGSTEDVKKFIDTFMPEIPGCLGSLNSLVRVLAGRLLVDMVLATAGILPSDAEVVGRPLRAGRQRIHSRMDDRDGDSNDGATDMQTENNDGEEEEEVEEVRDVFGGEEDGGSDCGDDADDGKSQAPTEIASVCTAITITGMDPVAAAKTCAGLQGILSHLWPVLLEVNAEDLETSSNQSAQLLRLEVTAKSVCRLLSDLHLRRSLMTVLLSTEETSESAASASVVLAQAMRAARGLVQLPSKQVARLGLQIARLLIAFVGHSVYVSDIVRCIHALHPDHKHSLRFIVKAMVEKMLKKVGTQGLLTVMSPEYERMIRNSAKILRRKEQNKKTAAHEEAKKARARNRRGSSRHSTLGIDDNDDDDVDGDDALLEGLSNLTRAAAATASVKSSGSALAPSKRIHVQSFQEILAGSSDEDEEDEPVAASGLKAKDEKSDRPRRRQGLAAELERAASVAGLSRRSKRSLLSRRTGAVDSSDDDDDEEEEEEVDQALYRSARPQETRPLAGRKRGREEGASTYLVEAAGDVVDLAEPESLARHLTVAASAGAAKRALRPDALATYAAKRQRLTSLAASSTFPTSAEGKIIINEASATAKPTDDNWLLNANDSENDDDDEDATPRQQKASDPQRGIRRSTTAVRVPGSEYRSARAAGDMHRAGRPAPFAFAPLGAGLPSASGGTSAHRSGAASAAERRALLRALGAGRQKRRGKKTLGANVGGGRRKSALSVGGKKHKRHRK